MARTVEITYGSITVGKDATQSSYHLTDKFKLVQSYETALVEFEVIVHNATQSTFLTHEAALVAQFRTPRARLQVLLADTSRFDFNPSDDSGFNARPTVEKLGDVEDTEYSARYRCTVEVDLPADLSGQNARREALVDVSESRAGRKTVRLAGVWTASGGTAARAQYDAQVASYAATVLAAIDNTFTWRKIGTPKSEVDDTDKLLTFEQAWEQILASEGVGTTDVTNLSGEFLQISRRREVPEVAEGYEAEPLRTLQVSYAASVDTSDQDLLGMWVASCRPNILSHARTIAAGGVAVLAEEPVFDVEENRITAQMTLVSDSGASLLSITVETEDDIDLGVRLIPVQNGNPFARDRYQGPITWLRRVNRVALRRTKGGQPAGKAGNLGFAGGLDQGPSLERPEFEGFVELRRFSREKRFRIGTSDNSLPLELVVQSFTFMRADVVSADAA